MPSGVYIRTKEYGETMSRIKKGHPVSIETRNKIGKATKIHKSWIKNGMSTRFKKGILSTPKPFKKGMSPWNKGLKGYNGGEKSHFWKGGITPINYVLRNSLENKLWRKAVFERDNYTCIWCSQVGGTLNADHIQRWIERPDLRFAIDNGRTLCKSCHIKRHSLGELPKQK